MLLNGNSHAEQVRTAVRKGAVTWWQFRNRLQRHIDYRGFTQLAGRFYADMWAEAAERIGATVEDIGYGFLRILRKGCETFVNNASVMLDNHLVLQLAGNKPLFHKLLREWGYDAPAHCEYDLASLQRAEAFMRQASGPCVVKPAAAGAAGKGVTTNVRNARELRRASYLASAFSRSLLIEQQVPGDSYRLLYLNGEFLDAVRREPPRVQGDGRSSLRELIARENQRRLQADPIAALHPITCDLECKLTLQLQGRKLSTVPPAGLWVQVKTVVNQNASRENHSVRAQVHPDIIALGAELAGKLRIQLAGFDVMTPDISRKLEEVGGVINEVNTKPGLHHHYLISDREQGVPLAERILEFLLSKK